MLAGQTTKEYVKLHSYKQTTNGIFTVNTFLGSIVNNKIN